MFVCFLLLLFEFERKKICFKGKQKERCCMYRVAFAGKERLVGICFAGKRKVVYGICLEEKIYSLVRWRGMRSEAVLQ